MINDVVEDIVRTYPISEGGRTVGFEIDNVYVGVRDVARVLAGVEGVRDVRMRRPFSMGDQHLVRFVYRDGDCMVLEPFSDNSRWWIGQEEVGSPVDVSELEAAFREYRPTALRRLIGDILTLRFLKG
jgi:hypothetical protein